MSIYLQIYLVIGAAFAASRLYGFLHFIATDKEDGHGLLNDVAELPSWAKGVVAMLFALLLCCCFAVIAAAWPVGALYAASKKKGGAA